MKKVFQDKMRQHCKNLSKTKKVLKWVVFFDILWYNVIKVKNT